MTVVGTGPAPEPDPAAPGAAIAVTGLTHRFGRGAGAVTVLQDVNCVIAGGEYVALTGPSGAGKSTLLSLIGGIDTPQSGRLQVAGNDLASMSARRLAAYRRRTVGFVFQSFGLVDVLTAAENVELAMALARVPDGESRRRARTLLGSVGLASRADHRPGALSGGERQRVAIARALVAEPALLLADEPTGNLDETTAVEVMSVLENMRVAHGCTLVVVTHNSAVAHRAGRHLRLVDGQLMAAAS